ncbi:MAG: hypothetical protein C0594_16440, partial [Marinilabiliales bacterium]
MIIFSERINFIFKIPYNHRIFKMNNFCTECGNKLPADAKFCNNCGFKLPIVNEQNTEKRKEENVKTTVDNHSEKLQKYGKIVKEDNEFVWLKRGNGKVMKISKNSELYKNEQDSQPKSIKTAVILLLIQLLVFIGINVLMIVEMLSLGEEVNINTILPIAGAIGFQVMFMS